MDMPLLAVRAGRTMQIDHTLQRGNCLHGAASGCLSLIGSFSSCPGLKTEELPLLG